MALPRQIVPLWPDGDIVTRLRAQLDELPQLHIERLQAGEQGVVIVMAQK